MKKGTDHSPTKINSTYSPSPSPLDLYKHQIASPLTTIICSLEQHLLENNLWDKSATECKQLLDHINQEHPAPHLKRALASAQEISTTINFRDRHQHSQDCCSFKIADLVARVCDRFQKPYPLTIHVDLDSILEQQIYGNSRAFEIIITHLLNNAAESYPSRRVDKTIAVWGHPHQDGLLLAISDHGQGIATHDLRKIFRADFSTKKQKGGLGLWEVRKILSEEFGAEIDIRSKVNRGSTVFLFL